MNYPGKVGILDRIIGTGLRENFLRVASPFHQIIRRPDRLKDRKAIII